MDLHDEVDIQFYKSLEAFNPPGFEDGEPLDDRSQSMIPDLNNLCGHHDMNAGHGQHSGAHGGAGMALAHGGGHQFMPGHNAFEPLTLEEMMRSGGMNPSQTSSMASTSTTAEMLLQQSYGLQGVQNTNFQMPSGMHFPNFNPNVPDGNMPNFGSSLFPPTTFRPRLRWTNDLHNQFLESVEQLGGHGKATPSAILKHMAVDGLSLSHVKSHLQKYRTELKRAKAVRGRALNDMNQIKKGARRRAGEGSGGSSAEEGLEILGSTHEELQKQLAAKAKGPNAKELEDAMRTQLELQKMLCAQLEAQKKLQSSLEQHTKYISVLMQKQSNDDLQGADVAGGSENETSKP